MLEIRRFPAAGRRGAVRERLANKTANLFGVPPDDTPLEFGRVWACRFDAVTAADLCRGALIGDEAGEIPADLLDGKVVSPSYTVPYGPHTTAALLLSSANLLYGDSKSGPVSEAAAGLEWLWSHNRRADGHPLVPPVVRVTTTARIILELYYSAPALFRAALQARDVQRALATTSSRFSRTELALAERGNTWPADEAHRPFQFSALDSMMRVAELRPNVELLPRDFGMLADEFSRLIRQQARSLGHLGVIEFSPGVHVAHATIEGDPSTDLILASRITRDDPTTVCWDLDAFETGLPQLSPGARDVAIMGLIYIITARRHDALRGLPPADFDNDTWCEVSVRDLTRLQHIAAQNEADEDLQWWLRSLAALARLRRAVRPRNIDPAWHDIAHDAIQTFFEHPSLDSGRVRAWTIMIANDVAVLVNQGRHWAVANDLPQAEMEPITEQVERVWAAYREALHPIGFDPLSDGIVADTPIINLHNYAGFLMTDPRVADSEAAMQRFSTGIELERLMLEARGYQEGMLGADLLFAPNPTSMRRMLQVAIRGIHRLWVAVPSAPIIFMRQYALRADDYARCLYELVSQDRSFSLEIDRDYLSEERLKAAGALVAGHDVACAVLGRSSVPAEGYARAHELVQYGSNHPEFGLDPEYPTLLDKGGNSTA